MRLALLSLLISALGCQCALAASAPMSVKHSGVVALEDDASKDDSTAAKPEDESKDDSDTVAKSDDSKDTSDTEAKVSGSANKKQVQVYINGCPVCFTADEDWEFYQVDAKDIRQGNFDLMRDAGCCGAVGNYEVGAAIHTNDNDDPQLRINGPPPEGVTAGGQWRRRTNSAGDWQDFIFDFGNEDNHSETYDRRTLRGNWDGNSFTRNGQVWGLVADDVTNPTSESWQAGSRSRTQNEVQYRNGSAEGNSWQLDLRNYNVHLGPTAPAGADDSRSSRVELSGRVVDCDTTLDAGAFAGTYRSNRALEDNSFTGARLDGSHWLTDRLELAADGSLTRIDASLQNGTATRSNYNAELGWDMTCDTRLTGFARGYSDDSDISAGSRLKDWRDTGARLDYRPDGDTAISASLANRQVDTERLTFEDSNILQYVNQVNPVPTRADTAGFRVDDDASGRLLDIEARHRWDCRFYSGASYKLEDFSTLPVNALIGHPTDPSYYADRRMQASVHADYDLCDMGDLTLRADTDQRDNNARGSSYRRNQFTLGYSAPLYRSTRLGVGVTRQTTAIDTTNAPDDFDGSGWDYTMDVSGCSGTTSYTVSAARSTTTQHLGGDLSSLGVELDFDSPWKVSAWWRQYDGFLGVRSADDAGVQVGYRIDL